MRTAPTRWMVFAAIAAILAGALYSSPGRPSLLEHALRHFGLEPRIVATAPVPGRKLALSQLAFAPVGNEPAEPVRPAGRPMLIDVFASWCPPCRQELAALAAVQPQLHRAGIVLTGIDRGESAEQVDTTMQAYGLHYPVYIDTGSTPSWASIERFIPTTIVLDDKGIVRFVYSGPLDADDLREIIRAVHA